MKLLFDKQVKHYSLDASIFTYGRLCSEIAHLLMGKANCCRAFNQPRSVVSVSNLYNVKFSGKKKTEKLVHRHHSGYPGGLKEVSIERYIEKGMLENCIRKTVTGMMSKTTHFEKLVKRSLIFKNE